MFKNAEWNEIGEGLGIKAKADKNDTTIVIELQRLARLQLDEDWPQNISEDLITKAQNSNVKQRIIMEEVAILFSKIHKTEEETRQNAISLAAALLGCLVTSTHKGDSEPCTSHSLEFGQQIFSSAITVQERLHDKSSKYSKERVA